MFQNDFKLPNIDLLHLINNFSRKYECDTQSSDTALAYYNFEQELIKNKYDKYMPKPADVDVLDVYVPILEIYRNKDDVTVESKIEMLTQGNMCERVSQVELVRSQDFEVQNMHRVLTDCKDGLKGEFSRWFY